jgi:hypothetical protein
VKILLAQVPLAPAPNDKEASTLEMVFGGDNQERLPIHINTSWDLGNNMQLCETKFADRHIVMNIRNQQDA